VLRLAVLALVLVTASAVLLTVSHSSAQARVEHSCGLTDREFLQIAQIQIEAVGVYGDDYLRGEAKAKELISVSREAARAVRATVPYDTSLQTARNYLPIMFLHYADAVRMREEGKNAAPDMYLAYQVGARVKQVLTDAEPALNAAGCDVSPLL
jgi:hypothetical protein